ncbi:MAG: hypothetical protein UE295_05895 [Acutalibacteraceae bacterium]|nr:hypothetical protein [Acutalibacteraceae bacterium]
MKKAVYILELLLQGAMLLISLVNIVYNLIEATQAVFIRRVFSGSMYLFFVPYNRYIDTENILELLILALFFAISIGLYVFSAKELFDDKKIKIPFTVMNFLWFIFSVSVPMFMAVDNEESFVELFVEKNFLGLCLSYITMFMIVAVLHVKVINSIKIIRSNPELCKEEFLPERFQLSAKSYAQIKRTAMGTPVIALGVFIVCLLLKYLNSSITFGIITALYIGSLAIMLFIFVGLIFECKSFQKRNIEKLPAPDFIKGLNKTQIISMLIFVGSYFIMLT